MYGKSKVLVDKGFTNSGDIIFEGNHTATYGDASTYKTRRSIDLGGFAGWVLETLQWTSSGYPTWKGNIVNTGAIKHIGKTTSGVRVGGIFAILEGSAPTITDGSFINTGDIVCTGEYSSNAAPFGVGGIAGVTFKGISNGKAFCNVNAINYPTAGMITGSPRSSDNVVSNCQLGGTITLSSQGVENGDGDMIYTPIIETIDESNFFDYIYGGETAWQDEWNYDGCSVLEVKPTI